MYSEWIENQKPAFERFRINQQMQKFKGGKEQGLLRWAEDFLEGRCSIFSDVKIV